MNCGETASTKSSVVAGYPSAIVLPAFGIVSHVIGGGWRI